MEETSIVCPCNCATEQAHHLEETANISEHTEERVDLVVSYLASFTFLLRLVLQIKQDLYRFAVSHLILKSFFESRLWVGHSLLLDIPSLLQDLVPHSIQIGRVIVPVRVISKSCAWVSPLISDCRLNSISLDRITDRATLVI